MWWPTLPYSARRGEDASFDLRIEAFRCVEAIGDMSRDGPTDIDGAEEAIKMIRRYQIRARALDHAVGERKIGSIQVRCV